MWLSSRLGVECSLRKVRATPPSPRAWGVLARGKVGGKKNPCQCTLRHSGIHLGRLLDIMVKPVEVGVKESRFKTEEHDETRAGEDPVEAALNLPSINRLLTVELHADVKSIPYATQSAPHRMAIRKLG